MHISDKILQDLEKIDMGRNIMLQILEYFLPFFLEIGPRTLE